MQETILWICERPPDNVHLEEYTGIVYTDKII